MKRLIGFAAACWASMIAWQTYFTWREFTELTEHPHDSPRHAEGEPCNCGNGIGCVYVPVDQW